MNPAFIKRLLTLVFALTVILVLSFAFSSEPVRHGDGHEYALTSQGFINHLTPEIRSLDIDDRQKQVTDFKSTGYYPPIFESIKQAINSGSEMQGGIYRANNNRSYGYHFWFYPAVVAGIESITHVVGANPLAGFQVANSVIFLLVLGYCLFFIQGSYGRKLSVSAAYAFGGSIFYLKWTHPEVMIVALLFVGFVALFQRSFKVTLACFALAAVQVVSLWAVFAVIPLLIYLDSKQNFIGEISQLIRKWWVWFFCLLPLASPVFYYANFGKISLIGAGYTNIKLLTFSHFFSFWFDLDQGAIVGAPWLIIVGLFLIIKFNTLSRESVHHLGVSLFGALLICLPLLTQVSVNSGQSVFQRYSFYAVTPIVAWAGFYLVDIVKNKWAQGLLLLASVSYALIFSGANASEDYLQHKPWTKIILEYFPDYYNPEPGVFYPRTSGLSEWYIDGKKAVQYKDHNGVIRKILFPIENADKVLAELCIGRIVNTNGTPISLAMASNRAYGWAYINGEMRCDGIEASSAIDLTPQYESDLKAGIDFAHVGFPSFVEFAGGISGYENWGRWSSGDKVLLKLKGDIPTKFNFRLIAGGFGPNVGKPVSVNINGVVNTFILDSAEPKEYVISFSMPNKLDGAVIQIVPSSPASPKSLGMSEDTRVLALSMKKIAFDF